MAKNKKQIPTFSNDMITVYNRKRVVLEGVECIIFCNSVKMIFKKKGVVTVEGKGLHLQELGNDLIGVCGELSAIFFGEGKQ